MSHEKMASPNFKSPLSLGSVRAPKPKFEICRPMKLGGDVDENPEAPKIEELQPKPTKQVEISFELNFINLSDIEESELSEGKSCDTFIFIQPKVHPDDYSNLSY